MPRVDGSYPSFGVEHGFDIREQVLPQVSGTFTTMGDGLLTGATPKTTNGGLSLDPSPFLDLKAEVIGATDAGVTDGLVVGSSPMAFSWPDIVARTSGSGVQVGVRPNHSGNQANWKIHLRILDGSSNGYLVELTKAGAFSLCLVSSGTSTVLESRTVTVNADSLLGFFWDGGSRFKATWGDTFFTKVDDTHAPLGSVVSVVTYGLAVESFTAGVTEGITGFAVSGPQRDVMNVNILMYDSPSYPWPVTDATPLDGADSTVLQGIVEDVTAMGLSPFMTLAYCPPEYQTNDATPGGAPGNDSPITDSWAKVVEDFPQINNFIIWRDNLGLECGIDSDSSYYLATPQCELGNWDVLRYLGLYRFGYEKMKDVRPSVQIYGPNCVLAERFDGFDVNYNGVVVDSRDMQFLQDFIDQLDAATPLLFADGIAVSGAFTNSDWELLIPYLKTMIGNRPLVITALDADATPTQVDLDSQMQALNDALDTQDKIFADYSGFFFESPRLKITDADWVFTATLTLPDTMKNAKLKVVTISDKVLLNGSVSIQGDGATPYYLVDALPSGSGSLLLGNLEEGSYLLTIFGDRGDNGTAILRIGLYSDNFEVLTLADTKYLGGV